MKPQSALIVAFGLVRSGLAAPILVAGEASSVAPPLFTDDALTTTRPRVGRFDTAAAVDGPADVSPPTGWLRHDFSGYASTALKHLSMLRVGISIAPVFTVEVDDVEATTDPEGDLVVYGNSQRVRAIIWDPATRTIYMDPMSNLGARIPTAILIVCLWLLFTCLYLGSSEVDQDSGDNASAILQARRLIGLQALKNTRDKSVEKPALNAEEGAAGHL